MPTKDVKKHCGILCFIPLRRKLNNYTLALKNSHGSIYCSEPGGLKFAYFQTNNQEVCVYMYVLNRLRTIHILSPSMYDCRLHWLLEDYSLVSPLGHSELTLYLLAVLYTGDGKLSPTYSNNPIMDSVVKQTAMQKRYSTMWGLFRFK